jgi:hypothetical protein
MARPMPASGITTLSMIDANLVEEIPLKALPIGLKIPEKEIARKNTVHLKFLRAFKPPNAMTTATTIAAAGTQPGKFIVKAPVPGDRFAWAELPPAVGFVAPVAGSRAGVPEPQETEAPPPGSGRKTVPYPA